MAPERTDEDSSNENVEERRYFDVDRLVRTLEVRPGPVRGLSRIAIRMRDSIISTVATSAFILTLVAVPIGLVYIGLKFGALLFYPTAVLLAGIYVLVMRKTGLERNYASWDFPLRRIFILPLGFAVAIAVWLLLQTLR